MKHSYKKAFSYFLAKISLLVLFMLGGRNGSAQSEVEMARQYVASNLAQQKLTPADIDGLGLSSAYLPPTTGWYHVYFNQTYQSIDIYNRMIGDLRSSYAMSRG